MKHVSVVQHTSSEWLGAFEDHLEGRGIRFSYFRPFVTDGRLPEIVTLGDGLMLLGGGPFGAAAGRFCLPTLDAEVRLARACLMLGKPVVGFGLGAQILSLAADGQVAAAPFALEVGTLRCVRADAFGGLPCQFPAAVIMRDRAVPPAYASVIAVDEAGAPAIFQIGANAFGFAGHPAIRRAMLEDLIMEFDEGPANSAAGLDKLSACQGAIDDALVPIMAGIVAATGWMEPS